MSMRESIFSIGSRMAQRHDDDIYFDVMTYEELQQMLDSLLQKIWMMTLENDMYERYLTRQDPQSLKTISTILDRAKMARRFTAHLMPKSSRMSFRASIMHIPDLSRHTMGSRASSVGSIYSDSRPGTSSSFTGRAQGESTKITVVHRMAMANKEVEEMKNNLDDLKETSRKQKAVMRAEIEELEIRTREAREAKAEFDEEVVTKGVDPITGKIPAEKVTRFIEDWLRSANTIIERLRLKSATLKMQIKKAKQQLVQREELGETLRAVDFEQLNIQNQDYVRMIEEKNHYVIEMKRIAGHYHLKLTQHKQKLNDLLVALNALKKEITLKQDQIKELESEHRSVEAEVKRTDEQLTNLLIFVENHTAPHILDFVKLQTEYDDLQKHYKLLERRRNIERIIFQAYQKQIRDKSRTSSDIKGKKSKLPDTMYPIAQDF